MLFDKVEYKNDKAHEYIQEIKKLYQEKLPEYKK